jgi:hypothetical protein
MHGHAANVVPAMVAAFRPVRPAVSVMPQVASKRASRCGKSALFALCVDELVAEA